MSYERLLNEFPWMIDFIPVKNMDKNMLIRLVQLNPEDILKIHDRNMNEELLHILLNAQPNCYSLLKRKWKSKVNFHLLNNITPRLLSYLTKNSNIYNLIYAKNPLLLDHFPKSQQRRIHECENLKRDDTIEEERFYQLLSHL